MLKTAQQIRVGNYIEWDAREWLVTAMLVHPSDWVMSMVCRRRCLGAWKDTVMTLGNVQLGRHFQTRAQSLAKDSSGAGGSAHSGDGVLVAQGTN